MKEKAFSSRTFHSDGAEFLAKSAKHASQDTVTKQAKSMQLSNYFILGIMLSNGSGVPAGVEHTSNPSNPSTRKAEVGGASSRLVWVTVSWGQPGLQSKVIEPTFLPKSQLQNKPPAGIACHHNEPFRKGLGLGFCEVIGKGSIPTSGLISVSNAGNMVLPNRIT